MNAPEYWWALSMSAGCLYALLASGDYQHSLLARSRVLQSWPHYLKLGIYTLWLPVLLGVCAVSLSEWLTEQSFAIWLANLQEFGKLVGILLSLQAVYFLFHGRVFGAWVLLVVSTLTLQLWLYYQSLGIEFRTLGLAFAALLFAFLAVINFALHKIDLPIRTALARPLAGFVLLIQWIFSATTVSARSVVEFDWLTFENTVVPVGLMFALILLGYIWQVWPGQTNKAVRT